VKRDDPEPVGPDAVWDRWEEVDQLLEQALDCSPEKREEFLETACGDDPGLLRAVRSVLRFSADAGDARVGPGSDLLKAAFGGIPDRVQEPAESLVGATVGAYRITGVLGMGGMGAVYHGERMDGLFERRVAIKVLRLALDTPGVSDRFQLERQILASLSHAGIAQMIDGGLTEEGRPCLVMEYVDGIPIDLHADRHGLGVDERVRLIASVAEAVEYAHRHMVVHRDLKPSNILVTAEGQVKLLDFGIAKLLEAPDEDALPATTRPEARFVTPEYAAPEQILGERVSTQTDVYALSALLYEMLTGVRPYADRGMDSVLERVIQGAEPTAPSAVIARTDDHARGAGSPDGEPSTRLFTVRSTTRQALRRRLGGDLDAILLRGLRSRPAERYGSVAALREDLERHLTGRAVTARGDVLLYRARKFARRHRVPVAAASAAFLVATGSAVGLALQRGAVIEERNRAEAAATHASREAETARQVTTFLVDLFKGSDPRQQLGDTITARALLERGAARVDDELAGQPAVRAELLGTLGQVYVNLGHVEEGKLMMERAIALRRDSIPARSGLAAALTQLGDAHRVARELDWARSTYLDAIEAAEAADDDRVLAEARLALGTTFVLLDRPDSAEAELRRGLELLLQTEDYAESVYLNALTSLAGLVRRQGDLAESEALYRQVVARHRALPETDPHDFAIALNNLAVVRRMQGELEEAAVLYREATDAYVDVMGPGHPTSLMLSGNLGSVLNTLERFDESLPVFEARVDAARDQWPEGHWRTGDMLMQLGATLIVAGRPQDAMDPLAEALDLMIQHIGPMHSWTDVYRGWLGTAAALAGRTPESEQLFEWSLAGLSSYEQLGQDNQVKGMLAALVGVMEDNELLDQAARYRAIVDLESDR
jgi:serine/threonine-protein kinase